MAGLIGRWLARWRSAPGVPEPEPDDDEDAPPESIVMPLGDELDLHTFQPREVGDLVAEYLTEAQAAGMTRVRIIHGKGTGALRRTVHAVLERHPAVAGFRLGDERSGSWGATLVDLRNSARD